MSWKRIACCTDIHFGKKADSEEHNLDCRAFIRWFCETARDRGCDSVAVLGDWNDSRSKIRIDTYDHSYWAARDISDLGVPVYWMLGNHDIFFRDNRTVHSLPWLKDMPNVVFVQDPALVGDTLFSPWLCTDEEMKQVSKLRARYVFGHFEFAGFLMNAQIAAPDRGKLDPEWWSQAPEYIFSGHFHKRQRKLVRGTEVHYIGNAFPHDFSDVGDTARGMMILERDGIPEYLDWPDMPSYHRVRLSRLLDQDQTTAYHPRATVRVTPDVATTSEDRDALRDEMREQYRVRELVLEPEQPIEIRSAGGGGDVDEDVEERLAGSTIEQIVIDHIRSLDLAGTNLSAVLLEEIFLTAGSEG